VTSPPAKKTSFPNWPGSDRRGLLHLAHGPNKPLYTPDALPVSEEARQNLVRVPTFPAVSRELLDQYIFDHDIDGERVRQYGLTFAMSS